MSTTPILIENRDGLPLRGDLHRPDGEGPHPLVVVAHGFKGFKDWGFFPHLAEGLAGAGLAALRFNFAGSGIGDDPMAFDRLDLFEKNSISGEIADLEDLVGALPGRPELEGVDLDRLGLFGHSRGGGVAVLFATREPRIRSLVTWAGVASWGRYFSPEILETWEREGVLMVENARTKQLMPLGMDLHRDLTERLSELDVVATAAKSAIPHLIVHGEADEAVPAEDGAAIRDASDGRAKLFLIEGTGHTFGAVHPFEGTTEALDAAVNATAAHFLATLV